jgi:hypothetical protein
MESTLKAGDKVRIIAGGKEGDNYHNFKHGDIVTIERNAAGDSILARGMCYYGDQSAYVDTQFIRPRHFVAIKAELDFTKPLETKEGKAVTILVTNGRGNYPVKGYIGESADLISWTKDGSYYIGSPSPRDLQNVQPKPAEGFIYVNVHNRDGKLVAGNNHETRAKADAVQASGRVACMKIALVEGQFDD